VDNEIERLLERGAVLLEPAGPMQPTEYGKRWMDDTWTELERYRGVLLDVAKLAEYEAGMWDEIDRILREENVPVAITSGISQYAMSHIVDHLNGKTSFTMPSVCALALGINSAPTSISTGALGANEAAYTGYARQTIAGAGWVAATAATPSVGANAATITFGNCTAGTATLVGFLVADSATVNAGNALWYGTLTSTVISTTQTPPTIAAGALAVSVTGT
jgi:hypothetical protein